MNGRQRFSTSFFDQPVVVYWRVHDNRQGQVEPRLWRKLRWKMRRCVVNGWRASAHTTLLISARKFVRISPRNGYPREGSRRIRVQGRIRRCRPWTSSRIYWILGVFTCQIAIAFVTHRGTFDGTKNTEHLLLAFIPGYYCISTYNFVLSITCCKLVTICCFNSDILV